MLNKTDLINKVRKSTGLTIQNSSLAVDTVLETILETLSKGERIDLRGFGSFSVRPTAARKTAFAKDVPSHGRVVFRPYKSLKQAAWDRVD